VGFAARANRKKTGPPLRHGRYALGHVGEEDGGDGDDETDGLE
jgi:hypothetical protein